MIINTDVQYYTFIIKMVILSMFEYKVKFKFKNFLDNILGSNKIVMNNLINVNCYIKVDILQYTNLMVYQIDYLILNPISIKEKEYETILLLQYHQFCSFTLQTYLYFFLCTDYINYNE
ncbi:unnamed protein product [Paramecium sonneborni]|uniref:Uncharacterized protein n=1 Tax=Paramecium sonneborni TaxID=65129 RepID=A0A8S1RM61_9CILI|nr:unnamed protein product [Paramecium sonneborni]